MALPDVELTREDCDLIQRALRKVNLEADYLAAIDQLARERVITRAVATPLIIPKFIVKLLRCEKFAPALQRRKARPASLYDVGVWVFNNLGATSTDEYTEPPPAPGALPFLEWAQKNRDEFYKVNMPKLMPTAAERTGEKKRDLDGDPAADTIRRLLNAGQASVGTHGANRLRGQPALS